MFGIFEIVSPASIHIFTGAPGPECTVDSQCGAAEACVAQRCVSACAGACGTGALCEPIDHRARCRCPPGTAGDPARACYTRKLNMFISLRTQISVRI